MPEQTSISYSRPKADQAISTAVRFEYRTSYPQANQLKLEVFAHLDPAAVSQEDTVEVATLGNAGDLIGFSITDAGGAERDYLTQQQSGDATSDVAGRLQQLLQSSPTVEVELSGSTLTLRSLTPGEAYTIADKTNTTNGAGLTVTSVTAASGTPNRSLLAELFYSLTADSSGKVTIDPTGQFYATDGTAEAAGGSPQGKFQSPKNLDIYQTNAGVARTN